MVGAIGRLEILAHPFVTIECFGWMVFFRAVFARRGQTFLSLLKQAGAFQSSQPSQPSDSGFIGRCINLERRAMRIYQSLAVRYARICSAREFFLQLAEQENTHAELLEMCQVAASRGRWQDQRLETWQQAVPETERLLSEAELMIHEHESLADSLRLVIRMESSQINGLFTNVVEATDTGFAVVFRAFRNAVRDHLGYIQERVSLLAPRLKSECDSLLTTPT